MNRQEAIEALCKFSKDAKLSEEERLSVLSQMKHAFISDGWQFDEFFFFHYADRTKKERLEFVREIEKDAWTKKVNGIATIELFNDKWRTYQKFSSFFRRDVIRIVDDKDKTEYSKFVKDHPTFMLKPNIGSLGKGIQKMSVCDCSFEQLLMENPNGFLMEEVIMQDPELAVIHPKSVNTLRVHTVRTKSGVKVLYPYLRMGRGENVVDNAGAGGIFTKVDPQTGVITNAVDEFCHTFTRHPDSGVELIGFKIPRFQEALNLSKQLAEVVPEAKYVGWDLALTPKGWVMVEGNTRAQFVFQIPRQEGFRKEFEKIKKEVE